MVGVRLAQREVYSLDELNSVDLCVVFAFFSIFLDLLSVSEFGVVAIHLESMDQHSDGAHMCSSF